MSYLCELRKKFSVTLAKDFHQVPSMKEYTDPVGNNEFRLQKLHNQYLLKIKLKCLIFLAWRLTVLPTAIRIIRSERFTLEEN
jgi:hypothetical protein